jgi:hypothetical protein
MTPTTKHPFLPHIVTLTYAIIFVQVIPLGFDANGMQGVFIAVAAAYVPLGLIAGAVWSVRLRIATTLAGIPAWVFIFAQNQWSWGETLTKTVEGVPVVLEPLAVSAFFSIGAWTGNRLFVLRTRRVQSSALT